MSTFDGTELHIKPLDNGAASEDAAPLSRGRLFDINEVKWSRVRKMMEKGKMERGVVELVDTESLVPQEHLLVNTFIRKHAKPLGNAHFLNSHPMRIGTFDKI